MLDDSEYTATTVEPPTFIQRHLIGDEPLGYDR
jgi:hypothetical protein